MFCDVKDHLLLRGIRKCRHYQEVQPAAALPRSDKPEGWSESEVVYVDPGELDRRVFAWWRPFSDADELSIPRVVSVIDVEGGHPGLYINPGDTSLVLQGRIESMIRVEPSRLPRYDALPRNEAV